MGWFEKETGYGGNTQFSLGMSMTSCTDWLKWSLIPLTMLIIYLRMRLKRICFVQGVTEDLYKEMFYNLGMGETVVHTDRGWFQ